MISKFLSDIILGKSHSVFISRNFIIINYCDIPMGFDCNGV